MSCDTSSAHPSRQHRAHNPDDPQTAEACAQTATIITPSPLAHSSVAALPSADTLRPASATSALLNASGSEDFHRSLLSPARSHRARLVLNDEVVQATWNRTLSEYQRRESALALNSSRGFPPLSPTSISPSVSANSPPTHAADLEDRPAIPPFSPKEDTSSSPWTRAIQLLRMDGGAKVVECDTGKGTGTAYDALLATWSAADDRLRQQVHWLSGKKSSGKLQPSDFQPESKDACSPRDTHKSAISGCPRDGKHITAMQNGIRQGTAPAFLSQEQPLPELTKILAKRLCGQFDSGSSPGQNDAQETYPVPTP